MFIQNGHNEGDMECKGSKNVHCELSHHTEQPKTNRKIALISYLGTEQMTNGTDYHLELYGARKNRTSHKHPLKLLSIKQSRHRFQRLKFLGR